MANDTTTRHKLMENRYKEKGAGTSSDDKDHGVTTTNTINIFYIQHKSRPTQNTPVCVQRNKVLSIYNV